MANRTKAQIMLSLLKKELESADTPMIKMFLRDHFDYCSAQIENVEATKNNRVKRWKTKNNEEIDFHLQVYRIVRDNGGIAPSKYAPNEQEFRFNVPLRLQRKTGLILNKKTNVMYEAATGDVMAETVSESLYGVRDRLNEDELYRILSAKKNKKTEQSVQRHNDTLEELNPANYYNMTDTPNEPTYVEEPSGDIFDGLI